MPCFTPSEQILSTTPCRCLVEPRTSLRSTRETIGRYLRHSVVRSWQICMCFWGCRRWRIALNHDATSPAQHRRSSSRRAGQLLISIHLTSQFLTWRGKMCWIMYYIFFVFRNLKFLIPGMMYLVAVDDKAATDWLNWKFERQNLFSNPELGSELGNPHKPPSGKNSNFFLSTSSSAHPQTTYLIVWMSSPWYCWSDYWITNYQ